MDERDLLVAFISTGLGITLIYGILGNPDWLFRLRTPHMLERNLGRRWAKLVLGGVGAILILMGAHLVTGPWLGSITVNHAQTPVDQPDAQRD
ncbi:MAG: hypothetical protein MK108_04890 [Mariniblastus sp.]|nr:hypothetical protein [Mariniblastus sp.]